MTKTKLLLTTPHGLIAGGFGSGLSPWAPGTAGSAAALLPFWWLHQLPLPLYLLVCVVAFMLGVWACGATEKAYGGHDHGFMVWDEFVGQWIALISLPFDWRWLLAGFLVFRFFDILKPFPIRKVDKQVAGGLGVMLDDVLAGIMAAAVLQAAMFLIGMH